MNLEIKVSEEMNKAMKSGERNRLDALRMLRAAIIEFKKSGVGRDMNEDDEINILKSAVKKRKEAMEMYEKGGRQNLFDKEKEELAVIEEFMPAQMSDEEIKTVLLDIKQKTGDESMQDMGKMMGLAMKEMKGKADGAKIKDIVKELLG